MPAKVYLGVGCGARLFSWSGIPMNRYKRSWLPAIVVVAISFAASYGFTGPLRAAVPTLFGEVHGSQMAINRRLDITAFTLAYFRKPFQLPKLATSLGVGPAWASRAPRKAIRLALERSGLRVSEGSTATFAVICVAVLGAGVGCRIAMAQLQGGNPGATTENGEYCKGLGFPCLDDIGCSMAVPCPPPNTHGCFDDESSAICNVGTSSQQCTSLPSFQCNVPIIYDGTCSGGTCNYTSIEGKCGKAYYPDCTGSQ